MRWFFIQAKSLQRFRLWGPILIKAFIVIEFINHLLEFFPIDDPANNIRGTPSTGLIEITVIEHIALFEVFSCHPSRRLNRRSIMLHRSAMSQISLGVNSKPVL